MIYFAYILVLVFGSLFAFSSQSRKRMMGVEGGVYYIDRYSSEKLIVSFLIALFFLAFCNVGSDYDGYVDTINAISWESPNYLDSEICFNYLCIVLKTICLGNPDLVIAILKTITLAGYFASFYYLKDYVSIGFSVFLYIVLYWLTSFYLLNFFLAGSALMLSFSLFYSNTNKRWSYILLLIGGLMHYSALFVGLFFLVCYWLKKKRINTSKICIMATITLIAVYASFYFLVNYLGARYEWFHYALYLEGQGKGQQQLGMRVFVEFGLLALVLVSFFKKSHDNYSKVLFYLFFLSKLGFSLLGYEISIASRLLVLLAPLELFFLSHCFRNRIGVVPILAYAMLEGYFIFIAEVYGDGFMINYHLFNPIIG